MLYDDAMELQREAHERATRTAIAQHMDAATRDALSEALTREAIGQHRAARSLGRAGSAVGPDDTADSHGRDASAEPESGDVWADLPF